MSLVAELKRRNVFRVGAAYLVLAWVVVQVLSTLMPIFGVPEWTLKLVVMLGALGFPCVLLFSWVYELTPDGLKRESEVDRSRSITNVTAKRLDYITIGLLVAAIAVTALDRFTRNPEPARTGSTVGAGHARDTGAGATESAAEDSRGHGPLPQQATVGVPAPDDKSIAVLPFVNISDDKANEYFSDGISEELLNLLAKVPELKVIARTSSFSFKGEKIDIPTVAAKLHVAHVLEGSVRKAGNKVRVTAQLIRTDDSTHLWSETYDRSLDDIFAVQDEIAAAVVAQLKITLLGEAPKAREVDPQVYTMYLQGRALAYQFTQAGYELSIELLQQALKIDPSYAPAWRMLAVNYNNQAVDGFRTGEDAFRLSSEAVGKALAADPNYAAAYSTLSATLAWNFDVAGAARAADRALALGPSDVLVIGNTANLLGSLGRLDEAIAFHKYALAHDPVSAVDHGNLGAALLGADRFDESIAASRTALSLSPGYVGAEQAIGQALWAKGDRDGALAAFQREPGEPQRLARLAIAHHALERTAESDAELATLIERFGPSHEVLVAGVHAMRGDKDKAFEWLDKAVAAHSAGLVNALNYRDLASLRDDPRWLPFLRRIGRAPEQLAAIKFDVRVPTQ